MTYSGFTPQLHYVERKVPAWFNDVIVVVNAVNLNRHACFIEFLNFFEDTLFEGQIAIEAEALVEGRFMAVGRDFTLRNISMIFSNSNFHVTGAKYFFVTLQK